MTDLIASLRAIAADCGDKSVAQDYGTSDGAKKAAETRKSHGGFVQGIASGIRSLFTPSKPEPKGWNPKYGLKESGKNISIWNRPNSTGSIKPVEKPMPKPQEPKSEPVSPNIAAWRKNAEWNLMRDGDMWIG